MHDLIAFGLLVGLLLVGFGLGQLAILVFGTGLLGVVVSLVVCVGFGLAAGHYGPRIAERILRRKD